jgi:glyoxylase-like metal-dependent hydrolase (beta-lactamase superfamily II)
MSARVEHAVTSGTFSLDGGTWDVDNNVWVIGDDRECVVIDAPHDADAIATLVGDRRLVAVLCTHAHDDHVNVALDVADRFDAPVRLHPADAVLWQMIHRHAAFEPLADGDRIEVGGATLQVLHTPGHSPGAVCFHAPDLGSVFTGDTLFQGGPGATGRSYSDFDTIVASIRSQLLPLPADTLVHTGHGPDTTIGAEAAGVDDWTRPD